MEVSSDLRKELEELSKTIKAPNIAVIGRTGAGKSTLINKVFGKDLAPTGSGFPVSKEFIRYPKDKDEKSLVVLYDSAGYEANKEEDFIKNIFLFLDDLKKQGIESQIHLVWYVVHAASKRFEYFDAEIVKKLNERGIPTIIVLPQCDLLRPVEIDGIEKAVEKYELEKNYELVKVAAFPINGEPFGLEELVEKTSERLPEIYADAFAIAQIASMKAKRKTAWGWVATAAGGSFAVGFVPVTGTTPAAIIAAQLILWNRISALYGYTNQAGFLMAVSTFGGAALTSIVGTLFLEGLGIFVPPAYVATSVGAAIISASYTVAVGLAYISTCEKLGEYIIKSNPGKQEIQKFLQETLRSELKKYQNLNITSKGDIDRIGKEFIAKGSITVEQ